MDRLFDIYKRLLEIHIGTKTTDDTFHKVSEKFYELLFDIFHKISEKNQDIEIDEPIKPDEAKEEALELLMEAKDIVEEIREEEISKGMNKLTEDLLDELEFNIGTAKSFIKYTNEND